MVNEETRRGIETVPSHASVLLLFPERFRAYFFVFGQTGRDLRPSNELSHDEVQAIDVKRVDAELLKIRRGLEDKYKTKELDFYTPPLVTQWRTGSSFEASTKDIEREHMLAAIAEIDRDGIPHEARACSH